MVTSGGSIGIVQAAMDQHSLDHEILHAIAFVAYDYNYLSSTLCLTHLPWTNGDFTQSGGSIGLVQAATDQQGIYWIMRSCMP